VPRYPQTARQRCIERRQNRAGPAHHRDGNGGGNTLPRTPTRELFQIVAAHKPDESRLGKVAFERRHGVDRIARAQIFFDVGDTNKGRLGGTARTSQAHLKCVWLWLQRISRRDQPPDVIELERPMRYFADVEVTMMGGIETSAQKADAQPVSDGAGRFDPMR